MKKQNKRLLLNKENIRVLSGDRLASIAGGTIDVTGLDTGGGDSSVIGPAGDEDSNYPTCPFTGSASKGATYAC